MSRIGKAPVILPDGVTVSLEGRNVKVQGPKGELSITHHELVKVSLNEKELVVERSGDDKASKSMHGLTRTLIANMVEGVHKGFEKRLEIHGVGYRAQATGTKINLTLGFSHPVEIDAPAGINVEMDKDAKNEIIVQGIDKQLVGEFAANLRSLRKPEPYKGKGIRYKGEYVRRKAGKTAKK